MFLSSMRTGFSFFIAAWVGAALFSCKRDKPQAPAPSCPGVDTLVVSYSAHILPMMQQYCTSCHGGANPSARLSLETYDQIRNAAANCYDQMVRGKMPPSGKLDDCTITRFKRWMDSGYPQ